MKRDEEETWKALLGPLTDFALKLEHAGFPHDKALSDPLNLVTYQMLIQVRRLSEGVALLGSRLSYEASLFARAMLETWVNANWLRLETPKDRAERFLHFHALDGMRVVESVPEPFRHEGFDAKLQYWQAEREKIREMFFIDGKWSTTWALKRKEDKWIQVGSLSDRLRDVSKHLEETSGEKEMDDHGKMRFYFFYTLMSQGPHGTPLGLGTLLDSDEDLFTSKEQPSQDPNLPLKQAVVGLMWFVGVYYGEFGHEWLPALKAEHDGLLKSTQEAIMANTGSPA